MFQSPEAAARALFHSGVSAHAAGRLDESIAAVDAALRLAPDFPEALSFAGFILQQRGHPAVALRFYERALALKAGDAVAWFNRGVILLGERRLDEALASLEKACELQPENPGFQCNRGAALYELGRLHEAADVYGIALAQKPDLPQGELNLANALMRLGRYRDAREAYLRAIGLRPDYALAFCGLGIVAKELGWFEEAMQAFDRALALAPDSEEALSNRGCLNLLLGNFAEGWEGYEYRWARGLRPVPISEARFDPANVAGRRILVVNDHGLGDTIQFYRYVVLLVRGGARVTVAAPTKIRRLLDSSGAQVTWRDESDLSGDFDDIIAISSLPRAFTTRLDTIPAPTPYLSAEPARVAAWRAGLQGGSIKIGLCWRGNADFRVDPRRSIPPEAFLPLTRIEGARLISVQKGVQPDDLPAELASRLENLAGDFDAGPDAFLDTAAIMAQLDLVITCDTSIAHLAGALGRPVWVALRHVAEWRWLCGREDSPWYPNMRLFRCGEGDDWTALLGGMAAEIAKNSAGVKRLNANKLHNISKLD